MGSAAKKTLKEVDEVVFAEERRLPLSKVARDAFLKALENPASPNSALKQAARRYKRRVKSTITKKK